MLADRFFPSSKLCRICGHKLEELTLDARRWICPVCGTNHDRDLTAAKNLGRLATQRTASFAGIDACGAERSMSGPEARQVLRVEAGTDDHEVLRQWSVF